MGKKRKSIENGDEVDRNDNDKIPAKRSLSSFQRLFQKYRDNLMTASSLDSQQFEVQLHELLQILNDSINDTDRIAIISSFSNEQLIGSLLTRYGASQSECDRQIFDVLCMFEQFYGADLRFVLFIQIIIIYL